MASPKRKTKKKKRRSGSSRVPSSTVKTSHARKYAPIIALAIVVVLAVAGGIFALRMLVGDGPSNQQSTPTPTPTWDPDAVVTEDDSAGEEVEIDTTAVQKTLAQLESYDFLEVTGEYRFSGDVGLKKVAGGYRASDETYVFVTDGEGPTISTLAQPDGNFIRTDPAGWTALGYLNGDDTTAWARTPWGPNPDNPGIMTPRMVRNAMDGNKAVKVNPDGEIVFEDGLKIRPDGDKALVVSTESGRRYTLNPPADDTGEGVKIFQDAANSTTASLVVEGNTLVLVGK